MIRKGTRAAIYLAAVIGAPLPPPAPPPPPDPENAIQTEAGDNITTESGDSIIVEA